MLKIFKIDQSIVLKNQKCISLKKKLHFTTTNDFPTYEYDDYKFIQLGYLGPTNISDYSLSKYKDFMILNSFLEKIENFNFDYRALMVAKLVSHLIRKHAILRSRRPPMTLKNLTLFSTAVRELFKCSASCCNLVSHAFSS